MTCLTSPQRAAPAPALAPTQYTTFGPPLLPLRDGTNSALYVPLLLDAAGMLAAQAQRDWRSRAPINEWWPAAVDALRARAFIPVQGFPQLWSMSPWLLRPRFCTHPRFYGFGPGPRNGPDTSRPLLSLSAQLPWHPKATISQHRYRRRCLLFWWVPQPSPPLHVS